MKTLEQIAESVACNGRHGRTAMKAGRRIWRKADSVGGAKYTLTNNPDTHLSEYTESQQRSRTGNPDRPKAKLHPGTKGENENSNLHP